MTIILSASKTHLFLFSVQVQQNSERVDSEVCNVKTHPNPSKHNHTVLRWLCLICSFSLGGEPTD